jgi:uncharacterized protein YcnI
MSRRLTAIAVSLLLASTVASAHVTVRPRESGAEEKYTVRVPTEGAVSTVKVELEIPDGVTVIDVPKPEGATLDVKRANGRITSIVWTKEIKPKEAAEFMFTARNPKTGEAISWKAHQHFADGTTADWVGPPEKRPAALTKLLPKPQDRSR